MPEVPGQRLKRVRAVGVTAPPALSVPVRGSGYSWCRNHGQIADGDGEKCCLERRIRWSSVFGWVWRDGL